jgi:hypothetical protein
MIYDNFGCIVDLVKNWLNLNLDNIELRKISVANLREEGHYYGFTLEGNKYWAEIEVMEKYEMKPFDNVSIQLIDTETLLSYYFHDSEKTTVDNLYLMFDKALAVTGSNQDSCEELDNFVGPY